MTLAIGGDNTYDDGGFRYHEFTASDDLTVLEAGDYEKLIVAGGGGGGRAGSQGGGGGAGGVLVLSDTFGSTGTFPAVVGAGGAGRTGSTGAGVDGNDSSFDGDTADGGGGGAAGNANAAGNGGSGGGGGLSANQGTGIVGQGNDGGAGHDNNPDSGDAGGGGGGADTAGGNASDAVAGDGGDGITVWGLYDVGGGGGGGTRAGTATPGTGGFGGGGDGGAAAAGTPGDDGTGGGGGGGGINENVGDGGDGIVVIRYLATVPDAPFARYRAAGLTPGAISSWADEGTGGNDLVQATGAEQPTAEAAGFNGHDSVLFDGDDDIMATGAYGAALSQPNTIVVMGEWVDVPDSVVIYLFDGGPLSTQRNALFAATNVASDPYRMFAGSTLTATSSPFGTEGDDTCIVAIFNAGSSELHINDGGNTVSGSPNTQGMGAFTLGGRFADSGGERRMNFRVVETLIYDRALTAGEITALQNYFTETYLLPPNPFARYRAASLTPGAVDTWTDEGTGGNDLVQATGTNQPTAEAAGFNGHPSVLFDGVDNFMQTGAYGAAQAQPNTIVLMGEFPTVDPNTADYVFDGVTGARHAMISEGTAGGDPLLVFAGVATRDTGVSLVGNEGVDLCLSTLFNHPGDYALYLGDTEVGSGASPGGDNLGGFSLAARIDGTSSGGTANIRLVEVLIYNRALTGPELTALEDYFNTTYAAATTVTADVVHGIVLGHSVAGTVEEETVTADVSHGIVLGHQVDSSAEVTADAEHGIVLGHQVDATVGAAVADVSHGIVLGHAVDSSALVTADTEHGIILGHQVTGTIGAAVADVSHGIVLGHQVDASVGGSADVSHGIVLGHQVEATVEVPVSVDVAHGIVLGHEAVFTVEVAVSTRPIQPMADLRPIQPTFSAG